jgi:hypothetical protein
VPIHYKELKRLREDSRLLDALLDPEGPLCILHKRIAAKPYTTREQIRAALDESNAERCVDGEEPGDE